MNNEQKMLKELRALWKRDATLFNSLIERYQQEGPAMFPRDKRKRTKRLPPALDIVWASVEFIRWRDELDIRAASEKLARHTVHMNIYDNDTGMWAVGDKPQPDTFFYRAEGEKGKADGDNIRQTYYAAKNRGDQVAAMAWLDAMKAAHNGEESALDSEFLIKAIPPV